MKAITDTALSTPSRTTQTVRQVMAMTLLALLPGVLLYAVFFGYGVLIQIVLAMATALLLEASMLKLRGRPTTRFITDLSAPLTATLFALCIPPLAPWWIAVAGMFVAILLAKHFYGGLGYNLFNPAMAGVALVELVFPGEFRRWLPSAGLESAKPGLTDSLQAIFAGQLPVWNVSSVAPLPEPAHSRDWFAMVRDQIFGLVGVHGWEWVALGYLLGGVFLLWKKIIPWQIPIAVLGVALFAAFVLASGQASTPNPLQPVFVGIFLLGAFFISSDPVTGCASTRGRLTCAAGTGVLTWAIWRWSNNPVSMAFAVLLMNFMSPWIDLHTRPKVAGDRR